MKVALVSGSFPPQPCGVGDYTERLALELEKAGVQVEIVTSKWAQRRPHRLVRYELENWKLSHWRNAVHWINGQSFDIVHLQYPARFYGYRPSLALLTYILRQRIPQIPIVVTVHEFRITHLLRKLTVGSIVLQANAILVTAESERALYTRYMPWVRNRLHVVHLAMTIPTLPMSAEERTAVRRLAGIQESEIVIGYFGFLHPNKGIERLLESFAVVHARQPETKLVMISLFEPASNKYHEGLERLIASLKIDKAVVWTGFLPPDEVSRYITALDVAVFPFAEGVSLRRLSFITTLSHGIPTVTTNGQAEPDKLGLRDRENVLLVPAGGSAQSIADAVLEILDSRPLQLQLMKEGRSWAEPFVWKNVVQKTIGVYSSLIHQ